MAAKAQNYTADQTTAIVADYKAGISVADIAANMGRTTRSIIAKLSREGVYKAKEYTTKKGEAPISKENIAAELMLLIGLTEAEADSMAKANKTALIKVLNIVKSAVIKNVNDVS